MWFSPRVSLGKWSTNCGLFHIKQFTVGNQKILPFQWDNGHGTHGTIIFFPPAWRMLVLGDVPKHPVCRHPHAESHPGTHRDASWEDNSLRNQSIDEPMKKNGSKKKTPGTNVTAHPWGSIGRQSGTGEGAMPRWWIRRNIGMGTPPVGIGYIGISPFFGMIVFGNKS